MNCPYCNKEAKTSRGLIKHLTGPKTYGGHEFSVDEAQQILREGAVYVEEKEDRLAVPKNVHTTSLSAEFGPQYSPDDAFKARARLHQSKYRAEVLRVDYNKYGNRLDDDDGKKLLNYYDRLNSRVTLRQRYPSYSARRDADMLRSEHIPFNLIAPLATNKLLAAKILSSAFDINCLRVKKIELEYAPSPKEAYLNDGTAFDVYFEVDLKNGKTCGIGVEIKYTEGAYKIGTREARNVEDHQSPYWKIAQSSHCFIDPDNSIFGTDSLRQIWRNHLLGLAMIRRGDVDEFYSITMYPAGNTHFEVTMPQYIALLNENAKNYVQGCTVERFISEIGGSPEFDDWKLWLKQRYLVQIS